MWKRIVCGLYLAWILSVLPVAAAVPLENEPPAGELKGAKQFTPILDMVGKEVTRVGIRVSDNAIYSMEQLWKDALSLNFKH